MINTSAVFDRLKGEKIGPYRLEAPIGSGGMGTVWRAWDERLGRWVALKEIRADVTVRRGRERLWREARSAARLNHPSIVHVYDILEGTAGDWIVMELVEGRTIRCLLDEENALAPEHAIKLCREIAEGLAEAHAQGILHRDLKASNVVVTLSGRAKILDFGLAKEIPREGGCSEDRDLTLSVPGVVLGTCYAMSPEQVLGRPLDERSDLFSLGTLLYEMLTGDAPFRAETAALSLARILELKPRPLQQSHPEIPPAICELVDWLLQKEPRDRPGSAADLLAVLDAAASASGQAGALRPIPSRRPHEPTATTFAERRGRTADPAIPDPGRRQSAGERRTVTIVCCGLIQLDRPSGEMGALDLEVLSEATIVFENLAREICRELSGTLGAVLGRTLWLCFGYPQAHEDDAERAIQAARELQARFAALLISAAHRLALRTGVHTGPAVAMTSPSARRALQPGDTFDIAMAIQRQVPAGRIGVSAASRQLLGKKFATQPLPAVHVKDLDATVAVYELGPPLDPGSGEGVVVLPMVNREAELQILHDRFRLACSGAGQAVLIAGDAGIGKSRLVQALSEQLAAEAPTWLIARGSAFAQNTPLLPIIHLLERAAFTAEGGAEASAEEKLRRLEEILDAYDLPRPSHAPLLGALLSLPAEERYPRLVLSPEARRKRTLAAILALLGAMAERHPVVLAIEDLHWIDPSTLELLDLLLEELPTLPLLFVATFRPEFTAPWRHHTAVTQLRLGGLSERHATELIRRVAEGRGLPSEIHREIVARTDGIPLFVEELTKAVLEEESLLQAPTGIPVTLGSSLLARLDRLGEAKAVAQLAAVIGRTFSQELLEALSWIKGTALQSALGRLVQAEILQRRGPVQGARYSFRHALIQDAAYQSLLASDRQHLHLRLARLLQEDLPAVAEAEPELMAHHCERGGLTEQAVEYLQEAGLRALQRSAQLEAVSHLNRALALLAGLPAAPERVTKELSLRFLLAPALAATKGWGAPEVAANAERRVILCRDIGDGARLIPSIYSLWAHHLLRGDRLPCIDLADEIARLAETPAQVYMGYSTRAYTAYYAGRFSEGLALAEQAIALYEPEMLPELAAYGEEPSLMPHVFQCWSLWNLGAPERAIRKLDEIRAIAETLRSPFVLGMALLAELLLLRDLRVRETEQVEDVAERLMKLAREQEFTFLYAVAQCGKGWAVCQRGDLTGGMALIQAGIELNAAGGSQIAARHWIPCLIEAYLATGRLSEGLAAARKDLALSETRLDVIRDAEILRLQGELLSASGDDGAAEAAFWKAIETARGQGARALELRSAISLGRLFAEQGRESEALPALSAAYQAFNEGFATRDLVEARELLDQLSRSAAQI